MFDSTCIAARVLHLKTSGLYLNDNEVYPSISSIIADAASKQKAHRRLNYLSSSLEASDEVSAKVVDASLGASSVFKVFFKIDKAFVEWFLYLDLIFKSNLFSSHLAVSTVFVFGFFLLFRLKSESEAACERCNVKCDYKG